MAQLVAWLGIFLVGFTLMLWPSHGRSITDSLTDAGSSIFTLGFAEPPGTTPAVIVFVAAATGMVVVALQIGYLPTLYSAFNRRETEVALLNVPGRGALLGTGTAGPHPLRARLGSVHHRHACPSLYRSGSAGRQTWPRATPRTCRWSGSVPPGRYSSWVLALLAVLDSAALYLALSPRVGARGPRRLCLRGGFDCLTRVARAMGLDVPRRPTRTPGSP